MTIEEFIKEQRHTLTGFKKFWCSQRDYPVDLDPGEWDGQYYAYLELNPPPLRKEP